MINQALKFLLDEILHGTPPGADGTTFVQGNEALLDTLNSLTAEEASHPPAPHVSTIAAHLIHTNAYLAYTIQRLNNQEPVYDWPGTWAKQTVTQSEFQAQIDLIKTQVDQYTALLQNQDLQQKWPIVDAVANVAHAAYHLGAIRQIYLIVKAP